MSAFVAAVVVVLDPNPDRSTVIDHTRRMTMSILCQLQPKNQDLLVRFFDREGTENNILYISQPAK